MPQPLCLHLKDLESESIYILREAAAQFNRPVLLYSIGKDSSVLLHLARKAFFPGRPPFPLLHIDTRWKFREMIAFRESTAKRLGLDLIVYVNEEGIAHNINPIDSGSAVHTLVMKTEALKQALALELVQRSADRGGRPCACFRCRTGPNLTFGSCDLSATLRHEPRLDRTYVKSRLGEHRLVICI
jgi:hypothetical protein